MNKQILLLPFFLYSLCLSAQKKPDTHEFKLAYFIRFSELKMALVPIDTNQLKKIPIEEIQSVEMIYEHVEDAMGNDYAGQDAMMIISLTAKGEQNLRYLQKIGSNSITSQRYTLGVSTGCEYRSFVIKKADRSFKWFFIRPGMPCTV